jgi:hypothetical protein
MGEKTQTDLLLLLVQAIPSVSYRGGPISILGPSLSEMWLKACQLDRFYSDYVIYIQSMVHYSYLIHVTSMV